MAPSQDLTPVYLWKLLGKASLQSMSRKRPAGIGTGGAGLEHRKDQRGLCETGRKPAPQGVPLWDQRSRVTALPGKGLEAKQQILPLPSVSLQVPRASCESSSQIPPRAQPYREANWSVGEGVARPGSYERSTLALENQRCSGASGSGVGGLSCILLPSRLTAPALGLSSGQGGQPS